MKPPIVCFRDGAIAQVAKILDRLSAGHLFFVVDESAYTASGADKCLEPYLHSQSVTRFSNFELNPKLHDIERGVQLMRETNPDVIVALGGGTAIDLGKLVGTLATQDGSAREIIMGRDRIQQASPPLIAIPTTAGTGSEATHFAVAYVDREKYSVAHPSMLPAYAIVDPTLTLSLPADITAATGLDAFCQAIESIWAVGATDESVAYATDALRLAFQQLPNAVNKPTIDARRSMCRAAHLAGKAINISKTTSSHALSYSITENYGVPHGIAVALTLSPMLAYNAKVTTADCNDPRGPRHVLDRIRLILDLLESEDIAAGCGKIENLISRVGCFHSLQELGIETDASIRQIVSQVNTHRLSNNPRQSDSETLFTVLRAASRAIPTDRTGLETARDTSH